MNKDMIFQTQARPGPATPKTADLDLNKTIRAALRKLGFVQSDERTLVWRVIHSRNNFQGLRMWVMRAGGT
jgi:hypothetical protein